LKQLRYQSKGEKRTTRAGNKRKTGVVPTYHFRGDSKKKIGGGMERGESGGGKEFLCAWKKREGGPAVLRPRRKKTLSGRVPKGINRRQ